MTAPRMTRQRAAVLAALQRLGGINDPSGKATAKMLAALEEAGEGASRESLSGTLAKMEDLGMITRDIKGRRCFAIAAVGEALPEEPVFSDPENTATEETTYLQRVCEAPDVDYAQLAAALFDRTVEVLTDGDRDTLKARLADALAEALRLRERLREASDELSAVKDERDGLRQQRRALEANVAAVLKGQGHDAGAGRRALERFISETPNAKR